MRINMIIKLDGKPLDQIKPVTLTDIQFKKLRGKLLKRGYCLDVDGAWTQILVSSKGLSDSEILLLPKRIHEDLNGILNNRQRAQRRHTL